MKTNWLLLRGMARHQEHWNHFGELLKIKFPQSEVHYLDLPGTGTEVQRNSPLSISSIRKDLRGRWLELKKKTSPDPWALFSISLGSMVAIDWCSKHQDDFSKLVIVNSSAGNLNAPLARMNWKALPEAFKVTSLNNDYERELQILNLTTNLLPPSKKLSLAKEWADICKRIPIKNRTTLEQLVAATQFKAPHGLGVPTLILSSAGDRLVSPSCSLQLAKHMNLPIKIHPQAGHDIPLDDPEWVLKQLEEWTAHTS